MVISFPYFQHCYTSFPVNPSMRRESKKLIRICWVFFFRLIIWDCKTQMEMRWPNPVWSIVRQGSWANLPPRHWQLKTRRRRIFFLLLLLGERERERHQWPPSFLAATFTAGSPDEKPPPPFSLPPLAFLQGGRGESGKKWLSDRLSSLRKSTYLFHLHYYLRTYVHIRLTPPSCFVCCSVLYLHSVVYGTRDSFEVLVA